MKVTVGLHLLVICRSFVLQVFVSCPATPDLTSFHAPDSPCDLKSKVLW